MATSDEGGDPACWAHLFDGAGVAAEDGGGVVVDLGTLDTSGPSGVAWSLPHGGDLDANLVRMAPGDGVGGHVNDEVDALLFVQSGRGVLAIDGIEHELRADVVALVPKGAHRSVRAGETGLTYLSIHRRRGPLAVKTRRKDHHEPAR
jgi:mannose-6-phosphate isomerase-like protein (cupin superfamily)